MTGMALQGRMGAGIRASVQGLKHNLGQKILCLSHRIEMLARTSKSFSCIFKLIASCKQK